MDGCNSGIMFFLSYWENNCLLHLSLISSIVTNYQHNYILINNHSQCGYKRTTRVKEGIKTSTLSQISLLNYSKTLTATGNNTKLLFTLLTVNSLLLSKYYSTGDQSCQHASFPTVISIQQFITVKRHLITVYFDIHSIILILKHLVTSSTCSSETSTFTVLYCFHIAVHIFLYFYSN